MEIHESTIADTRKEYTLLKKTIRLRADDSARDEDKPKTLTAAEQKRQIDRLPGLALMFFLIFGSMGLYTVYNGKTQQENYRLLDARGQTASGQVTSKSWTGSKSPRYLLYYTFTDASGARREGDSPVSLGVYDATQPGAPVNVTYLPDRKGVATIGLSIGKRNAQTDIGAGYFLIAMGCVVASILALLPFLLRRKALRAAS